MDEDKLKENITEIKASLDYLDDYSYVLKVNTYDKGEIELLFKNIRRDLERLNDIVEEI